MKKLIIVLMVVAVASFLFVGCLPDTVTPAVTPTEPTEPTVAKTDTPFITGVTGVSLTSTLTQYAASGFLVDGVGVAGAVIKVYIDDVQTGVGNSGQSGAFNDIAVTMGTTLAEGVKVLHVTATQPGLAESDPSTKVTFTYDKTKPALASATADSSAQTITVTFSEDVDMSSSSTATNWGVSALNFENWEVNEAALTADYTLSKISDKKVRINCPAGTVATGTALFIEAINIEDNAGNAMADTATGVGVTAIGTP